MNPSMSINHSIDQSQWIQSHLNPPLAPMIGINLMKEKEEYRKEPVGGWGMWSLVFVFVAKDVIILILWIFTDRVTREVKQFPTILAETEIGLHENIIPMLEQCHTKRQNVWIGTIMGFNGILLVLGLFLAYESRNLKLKYINDSRWVSLAIYNVAILSLITGPICIFLLRLQMDASFGFVSGTVLLSVWTSVGLLYVPKIMYVWRVPESKAERESTVTHHQDRSSISGLGGGGPSSPPPTTTMTKKKLTKEEEEKFQRLLVENEEIKRQIQEKEIRIQELRERLRRRKAEIAAKNDSSRVTTKASVERVSREKMGEVEDSGYNTHIHNDTDVLL